MNIDNMVMAGHEVVLGRTQSGKTYYAVKGRIDAWCGGVLFFNPQAILFSSFIYITSQDDYDVVKKGLQKGCRLSYIPSANDEMAEKELDVLVNMCFSRKWNKLLFVADEAQDFSGPLRRIARRGLSYGIYGVFISQRPAELHNTLLTQATRHVIFSSSWENQYFKRYGLDAEKIEKLVSQGGQYAYVVVEEGHIKGPFKI